MTTRRNMRTHSATGAHSTLLAVLIAVLTLLLAGSFPVWAAEVHVEEEIGGEDRSIAEDYVFLGDRLGFSGSTDSLFFLGRNLSLDGETRRTLLAMAETIDVEGTVGDDALMAARNVNLTGTLGSTTFAAGQNVSLSDDAAVEGALFVAARRATLSGVVNGDVYAGARTLIISGTINGNVVSGAADIVIEDGATITGSFTYESDSRLSPEEEARIDGTVTFEEFTHGGDRQNFGWVLAIGKWVFTALLMLSALVFALLFYLFPGTRKGLDDERGHRRFWLTIAWGLIPFVAYPALIGALFAAGIFFGITLPIAFTLLFSAGAAAFVLTAFALPQIGAYLSRLFSLRLHRGEKSAIYPKTLLGFAGMFILGLVPFLNVAVFVLVLGLGWGVAIEKLFSVRLAGPAQ